MPVNVKSQRQMVSLEDDPVHGSQLRTDDPDEVVEVAQDVDAQQSWGVDFTSQVTLVNYPLGKFQA